MWKGKGGAALCKDEPPEGSERMTDVGEGTAQDDFPPALKASMWSALLAHVNHASVTQRPVTCAVFPAVASHPAVSACLAGKALEEQHRRWIRRALVLDMHGVRLDKDVL